MKLQELVESLEEIVMVDNGTISMGTKLDELEEWDSLAQIALLSVLEEKIGVKLTITALMDAKTFSDIVELVKDHLQ